VEDTTNPKRHVRSAVGSLIVFLIVAGCALGGLRGVTSPSSYVELSAGPVVGIHARSSGVSFTTVNVARLTWGGYFIAKITGQGPNLVPYAQESSPGAVAASIGAMKAAKEDAGIVARYAVTGVLPVTFYGGTVVALINGLGAKRSGIKAGDIVLRINGTRATSLSSITHLLQSDGRGARVVRIGLLRGEQKLVIPVRAAFYKGSWKIGIEVSSATRINQKILPAAPLTGSVEGPSGGLMFTLADISELTKERLFPTALAGTGTIDAGGGVGSIGGVSYKVAGAIAATRQPKRRRGLLLRWCALIT
jgi:PDZ domain-containing secreted protein